MTLNLGEVGRQIAEMARDMAEAAPDEAARARRALGVLREHANNIALLNSRSAPPQFVGMAAELVEPLDRHVPLPAAPSEYTVVATDGSSIEPDRHAPAYYYVLNVGGVVLRYGREPSAVLDSYPLLGYRPEDMYLTLGSREVPLEGGVLRVKRAVAETERLATLLQAEKWEAPRVGLQDGTLIPWMPEGQGLNEADLQKALLEPLFTALKQLRVARVPIASYISRPRSGEVLNTLRAAICPFDTPDCRKRCPRRSWRDPAACDSIAGVADRSVFADLPLADGERSALFSSRSRTIEQYREDHLYFCYVNVGSEIARLEMPEWVARDTALLALVHAAVYDQCRRGAGYPRALTEAHEKAVISVSDRQQCERLVLMALARRHVRTLSSEKQQSKRLRGL